MEGEKGHYHYTPKDITRSAWQTLISECVTVLNDFCTRMVDMKAGEDAQMPFGPLLLFLVFTQFSFMDDPGSRGGERLSWMVDSTQVLPDD